MNDCITSRRNALQLLTAGGEDGGGRDGGRSYRENDRVAGLSRGNYLQHHAHVVHGGERAVQRGVGVGSDTAVHDARSHTGENNGGMEAEVRAGECERVGAVLQRGGLKRMDGRRRVAGEDLEQHLLPHLQPHGQEQALSGRYEADDRSGVDGGDGTESIADGDGEGVWDGGTADAQLLTAPRVEEVWVDEVALDVGLEGGEVEPCGVQGEVQRVAGDVRADQRYVALLEAGGTAGVVVRHLLDCTGDGLRAVLVGNEQPYGHGALHETEVGAEEGQEVRRRAILLEGAEHEGGNVRRLQRDGHGVGGLDGALLIMHHQAHHQMLLQRSGRERRRVRGNRGAVHYARLDSHIVEDHLEGAQRALREVVGDRQEDFLASLQPHWRLRRADGGGVVGVHQCGGQLRSLRADIHRPLQELTHAWHGGALDRGGRRHTAVLRLKLRGGEAVGGEHLTAQREVLPAEKHSITTGHASAGRLTENTLHHWTGVCHREEVVGAQAIHLDAPLHVGTETSNGLAEKSRVVGLERACR